MRAVFALLPAGRALDDLPGAGQVTLRRYARADDAAHLLSLVRDGRDAIATQWLRGTALAVLAGAGLGAIVNGVLALCFGMFGGLLELAVPLGFMVGAFLGGFTAAMTGTQVARDEVKALAKQVRPGDVLLQWTGTGPALAVVATHCEACGLATTRVP